MRNIDHRGIHHDGQSGTKGLALFHAVRREDDGATTGHGLQNGIPEESASSWIHSSRWLICVIGLVGMGCQVGFTQEHNGRVSNESNCGTKLTLVTATVCATMLVCMFFEHQR